MTHRFDKLGDELHAFTLEDKPVFNGIVITRPDRLSRFNTRKPKVFAIWNDFWHESVPDDFQYYAIEKMVEPNTYLILTKRPHIAADFYKQEKQQVFNNIWHGLTVCNQQEADEKIPIFLQVPGKKFLSIEPMLEPIDLNKSIPYLEPANESHCGHYEAPWLEYINAVILGGETGPGARPMHPDWVRRVRDDCAAAGVPFFFKQWGEWCPVPTHGDNYRIDVSSSSEPNQVFMYRVGRTKAGRLLDGREYNDLPLITN
jgi:protein gp37